MINHKLRFLYFSSLNIINTNITTNNNDNVLALLSKVILRRLFRVNIKARSYMLFFYICLHVHWLPLRSRVCRGESAVCGRGGAPERRQGGQVSVGAAAARPGAVHGENDAVPIVMLLLQLVQSV